MLKIVAYFVWMFKKTLRKIKGKTMQFFLLWRKIDNFILNLNNQQCYAVNQCDERTE